MMNTSTRLPVCAALLACALPGFPVPAGAQPASPAACVDGMAGPFPCHDVDYLSFLSIDGLGGGPDARAANAWGWTDRQTGREYVLMGLTDGTAFVDVTDPASPVLVGTLPTQTVSSKWRDIKVYDDHAFIVADLPSRHGMQVFDLTRLRDAGPVRQTFTADTHFDGFGDAHNIFINRQSGFAYIVRTTDPELCGGALTMVDIRDPLNPSLAGCVDEGGLASDSYCVTYGGDDVDYQGREICVIASDDDLIVADVTDKASPVRLATLGYANIARAHNAWFHVSHNYFISADMNDELNTGSDTRIFVWDMREVDAPQLIGIYNGPTGASDHNVWLRGNKAYVGNFRAGLRILDATGIEAGVLEPEAHFDVIPEDDNPGHIGGAWAVYPFFPSRTLALVDKEAGLYLVREQRALAMTLRYEYFMADGSSGKRQAGLYDDGTFVDDAGDEGTWSLRPARYRLVLNYDTDAACGARMIGAPDADGGLRGARFCTDGSGVRGLWSGGVTEPPVRREAR